MSQFAQSYVIRDPLILERVLAVIRGNWRAMAQSGHPMTCQLGAESDKRSLDQNRLYWALLSDISDNAWLDGRQFSRDAWHEHFRALYLPKIESPSGPYPASTKSLTVAEFSRYIEKIEAYATSELGIELT